VRDDISDVIPFNGIAPSLHQRVRRSLPRLSLGQPPQNEARYGNDYEAADDSESGDDASAQTITPVSRACGGRVGRPINDTLPDAFTERTRAQCKAVRPKQFLENGLTE